MRLLDQEFRSVLSLAYLLLMSTIFRFMAMTQEAQASSGLLVLVSRRTVSLMKLMRSGSSGCLVADLSPLQLRPYTLRPMISSSSKSRVNSFTLKFWYECDSSRSLLISLRSQRLSFGSLLGISLAMNSVSIFDLFSTPKTVIQR